jgi:hypothetical protein
MEKIYEIPRAGAALAPRGRDPPVSFRSTRQYYY